MAESNCVLASNSKSNAGGVHRAPIAPEFPAQRFPRELQVLIEVWDVDRNQITWPAWLARAASDDWELHRLNCLTAWDRLLGSTSADRRWPTWFRSGEASA